MENQRAPKNKDARRRASFDISEMPVWADGRARLGQLWKQHRSDRIQGGGREADRVKGVPPLDAPPRQAERLPPFGGLALGVLRLAVGDPVAAFDDGRVRA